jgi:hypothetical protein
VREDARDEVRGRHWARRGIAMMAAVVVPLVAGCSYQAWYEGVRDTRRQDCYHLPPGEVQPCLDEVERVDYQRYRREREEAGKEK